MYVFRRATRDVGIREALFSVIDLETTGLDSKKDEIIALAIIPMKGLEVDIGGAYYSLIRPKSLNVESIAVHGLGPESFKKGARELEEVAKEALPLLSNRILVGHSVNFDYKFLERSFSSIGVELKSERVDIALLELVIRKLTGKAVNFNELSLESLAKNYGIKIAYRHNALADAFFAAYVFQRQLLRLLRLGVNTVNELLRVYRKVLESETHFSFL